MPESITTTTKPFQWMYEPRPGMWEIAPALPRCFASDQRAAIMWSARAAAWFVVATSCQKSFEVCEYFGCSDRW